MSYYNQLLKLNSEIQKLASLSSVVSFDQQVNMPSNGSEYRSEILETVDTQIAKALKSKKFLNILSKVRTEDLTVEQKAVVSDIEETVKYSNRIPIKIHSKLSKLQSKCYAEWEKVKTKKVKSDSKYLKVLEQYVNTLKEAIGYANQGDFKTNYDYLLNSYSKGFTSSDIENIFNKLLPFIKESLAKANTKEGDNTFRLSEDKILSLCTTIATNIVGQDNKDSLRLQKSTHPFCATLGKNDVRITTRIKQDDFLDSIGSTVHEAGHACYELGVDKSNYGNAIGKACSIACHEGISLFYEKHIGESDEMINFIADQTSDNSNQIKKYMRHIDPTTHVRIESDEITYQYHIINRFKIESELFNGDLKVKDIPIRWNELYNKNFTPDQGYAQDVHWSHGSFGYFPSYTLGHLIGAQLRFKMEQEIDLFDCHGNINYDNIREWLTTNYFRYGAIYNSSELVEKATGEKLNPEYWFKFINDKHNL